MENRFVKIRFDVRCDWEAFPPEYRVYVNDELFTERQFKWHGGKKYIKEMLQISAPVGEYEIRFEHLAPYNGTFRLGDAYVQQGPAEMIDKFRFVIK